MNTPEERDAHFMKLALAQARRAFWRTHPNPMVGAVIVRGDEIIASGFHRQSGQDHAEIDALRKLGMRAEGAEIFVTLEPCNHIGKTGPCSLAIQRAGIRRCIIGTVDPDPRVSGSGIQLLRKNGVECVVGVEAQTCHELNEPFFTRIQQKRPFLTAKIAMTLDGRIATHTGHSRWITGPAAREEVHRMRDLHDAVLVGTGTLLADNPALTTRLPQGGRNALRVVLDRNLRAPLSSQIFDTQAAPTLLVTSHKRAEKAQQNLNSTGVEVLGVSEVNGQLNLKELMRGLVAREITTVLCEGGGELIASLLNAQLVDRYVSHIAPKLIGGQRAPGPVGGEGVAHMDLAQSLEIISFQKIGNDLCIISKPQRSSI